MYLTFIKHIENHLNTRRFKIDLFISQIVVDFFHSIFKKSNKKINK